MEIVLVAVFSYFCGSIPFGLILTQIFIRQDIRKIGSGNIAFKHSVPIQYDRYDISCKCSVGETASTVVLVRCA